MDRKTPPPISLPQHIDMLHVEQLPLGQHGSMLVVNGGTQDVIRIDLILEAGTRYQQTTLQARCTTALLTEGTLAASCSELAEELDFMGSTIDTATSTDFGVVSLLSTHQHLERSMQLLADVLLRPALSQPDLDVLLRKERQAFLVGSERVATMARRAFMAAIFGPDHPYGRTAQLDDFDALTRDHVAQFHHDNHLCKPIHALLSGMVGQREIDIVAQHLCQGQPRTAMPHSPLAQPNTTGPLRRIDQPKDDALQSALRIGKATITRSHPDFPLLLVLNTALGGYFGSRLMSNLREDKGYTYGIGSLLLPHRDACVWSIAAEVGVEHTDAAIAEVLNEIDRICQEPIPEHELQLVKSYLMGELLRQLDGPFATADAVSTALQFNNLDLGFVSRVIDSVRTATPQQLLALAQQHLNTEGLVVSVAGGRCK